jgi:hypothetical protein
MVVVPARREMLCFEVEFNEFDDVILKDHVTKNHVVFSSDAASVIPTHLEDQVVNSPKVSVWKT